ncbi:hypothetical protein C8T65DRAFT_631887 [Cerioporus squamosus]|nr:hypothetical protein C8T65DRAFT_631887 [Cerioporus squamosus]
MTSTAQKEKDKGNAAFKAGDFPTAIGHYTAAFIADPSNATYPLNRAAAYLKLGKNEDAERDCDAVLRIDGKNVKGYFRRGQARVALQKLMEAEADFQEALKLEPANESVRQELKKVQEALRDAPPAPKPRKPIDVSAAPRPAAVPPKRRRVPITIVEPEPAPVASSSSAATKQDSDLLKPVSSRPLTRTSPQSTNAGTAGGSPSPSPGPSTPKPPPASFKEAKAAREEARPRGGIFKADGKSSLFYSSEPTSGKSEAPKREPPQTMVAFTKIWETLETEEERWDVLRQIPATRLPVLFKASLDASILAQVVHTLRAALAAAPEDAERASVVRAYMVNLPRVPRFNSVTLMMKKEEREDAQAVWSMLGRSRSDGVEGEMDRRKEDGSRRAWGCH